MDDLYEPILTNMVCLFCGQGWIGFFPEGWQVNSLGEGRAQCPRCHQWTGVPEEENNG